MHPPIRRSGSRTLFALLAAFALAVTACGDDDTSTDAAGETTTETSAPADDGDGDATFPVTVTSGEVETTIESRPESIVSLSPTATEMLFAIGAGPQVEAADEFSNFPADAPTTDLSGFDPNLEAIIEYEPDLVVLQNDANDVVAGLESVGVPTIVLPAAAEIADSYTQIELLGAATGHVGDAAEVVANMQGDLEELAAEAERLGIDATYYHELDDTLFSVTSDTFIGEVYALAGLENVADPADADGAAGGFPQLSAEFLIDADPDLVFLADTKCCGQTAETFAARPGFDQLAAVQNGNVIELDDDVASRWGPRIVSFLNDIVGALSTLEAPVG